MGVVAARDGDPDRDLVTLFDVTIPASDADPDDVMAALRKKYGQPDHHSHEGLGVIWTRERRTEAVMAMDGVKVFVERTEDVYRPLEQDDRDDTTNAACNRFVATFDAYLACTKIPLSDRLAEHKLFDTTAHLWYPLRFQAPVSDGIDHSGEGVGFVPAPADIASATRGCTTAQQPLVAALAKAGCANR
jgi:hypothetical protein